MTPVGWVRGPDGGYWTAVNTYVDTHSPRRAWTEFAASSSMMPFQTPAWMDGLLRATRRRDVTRLYSTANGAYVLPLVQGRHVRTAASMPDGFGFGGLVGNTAVTDEAAAACLRDLRSLPLKHVVVRPDPFQADAWRAAAQREGAAIMPHPTQIADLSGGFDHFWGTVLESATRTKIRRAERAGVEVERINGAAGVAEFYNSYVQWLGDRAHRRHQPPVLTRISGRLREPLRKYECLAQSLGDAFVTYVARVDGTTVATAIVLFNGDHACYWRSASDRVASTKSRANDLLQRYIIEDACTRGCRHYHMGESGGVESLMHFKARFGGRVHENVKIHIRPGEPRTTR
jgi:CelD/BcsL family acetyltransferase involved in cellulose biosynthesis